MIKTHRLPKVIWRQINRTIANESRSFYSLALTPCIGFGKKLKWYSLTNLVSWTRDSFVTLPPAIGVIHWKIPCILGRLGPNGTIAERIASNDRTIRICCFCRNRPHRISLRSYCSRESLECWESCRFQWYPSPLLWWPHRAAIESMILMISNQFSVWFSHVIYFRRRSEWHRKSTASIRFR